MLCNELLVTAFCFEFFPEHLKGYVIKCVPQVDAAMLRDTCLLGSVWRSFTCVLVRRNTLPKSHRVCPSAFLVVCGHSRVHTPFSLTVVSRMSQYSFLVIFCIDFHIWIFMPCLDSFLFHCAYCHSACQSLGNSFVQYTVCRLLVSLPLCVVSRCAFLFVWEFPSLPSASLPGIRLFQSGLSFRSWSLLWFFANFSIGPQHCFRWVFWFWLLCVLIALLVPYRAAGCQVFSLLCPGVL